MIGHTLRLGALAVLAVGLAACSSGSSTPPRTTTPANQSGTTTPSGMDHSGMGEMDHAQMMQHCRAMMQGEGAGMGGGMTHGGGARSNSMGQMDHTQMMQHCRAMMQSEGGIQPTR